MATHTINSESTPTPPRFQSAVVVPMPYPGARRSSFLRAPECHQVSRKVTIWVRFIERWQKRNCVVYRGIVRRLQTIYGQTRQMGDQLFLIRLGKEYKNQDLAQQVSSQAYLETFKDKPRSDNSEVLQFCQQFSDIFLILKMILTETEKASDELRKEIHNGRLDLSKRYRLRKGSWISLTPDGIFRVSLLQSSPSYLIDTTWPRWRGIWGCGEEGL